MSLLDTIFGETFLALLGPDGREPDDVGYRRERLRFDISDDRAELSEPVRFGPWRGKSEGISGWVIYGGDGLVVDCGLLTRPRTLFAGDELIYGASSIRAAGLGDVLGATFVFMPSGFVAVAAPAHHGGSVVGYAEPEEYREVFWLPKRRWPSIPESAWPKSLKSVGEILPAMDVGAVEYVRSALAEALLGIGGLEL